MAEDLMCFDASPAAKPATDSTAAKGDDLLSSFDPLLDSTASTAPSSRKTSGGDDPLGLPASVAAAFAAPTSTAATAASPDSPEEQQKKLMQALQADAEKMRGQSAKPADDDPFKELQP
eukprot:gb/GFBE01013980.1/.p1 GENE.gb/GFBE01013980.1/~~gb/GFBE01013980.1/.p1  ORF type:complete len:119 (+),score=34.39 gb/GFBE01013980.1/:1-357(+)